MSTILDELADARKRVNERLQRAEQDAHAGDNAGAARNIQLAERILKSAHGVLFLNALHNAGYMGRES